MKLLKPHARKASVGAWIPDQVDAKRGGAGAAIISVGDDNDHGHPHQRVIDRLVDLYPDPLQCVYLTEKGTQRNWNNLPHKIIHGVVDAIVIKTNGLNYTITNDSGSVNSRHWFLCNARFHRLK